VKHPKVNNTPSNKRNSVPNDANSPALADVLDAPALCRVVVDLKVKDNSFNEIVDFCARALHVTISKDEIAQFLLEAGKRAKHLNGIYDALVKPKVRYIVVDEIFQGRHNCYLGSADPASNYLFLLRGIPNRSEETLLESLSELAKGFTALELVITDGLRQYGVVVPDAFEDAVHLLCQVHAFRIILREKEKVDREAKKAYATKKRAQEALAKDRKKIYAKRRQLKAKQAKLAKAKQEREDYNLEHGIKKGAKKAPWPPERVDIKARVNECQAEARSKAATVAHAEEKVPKLQRTLEKAEKSFGKKKQASLQAGRLVARFKALLKCRPADFASKKERLEAILAQSKNPIAKKLRKFLKDHPEAFATKVPDLDALCPPSAATTNAIEGIFGLLRPLLKKARHFGVTPVTGALLEIVRLRHNLTPPYTGPNRGTSPLERAGVHSGHADYLDALFLPKGATPETGRPAGEMALENVAEYATLSQQISASIAPAR